MAKYFLIFACMWFAGSAQATTTLCSDFFTNTEARDGTDELISYLGSLLEHQIIGEKEFTHFVKTLEVGEWINPISEAKASVSSAALLHQRKIQEYLEYTAIDLNKLLRWAKKNLQQKEKIKVQREVAQIETRDISRHMEFYPIPPGEFAMGEPGNTVPVTLTHTIEMMSTKVTQKAWMELMGENPSRYKNLSHPVESLTWWSAAEFANRLSQKHGLKPVYDLRRIKFEGEAENGTLRAIGSSIPWSFYFPVGLLRINAPKGDIYRAEGYRLPTEAEQEYVRKHFGKPGDRFYFGDDETKLEEHAWFDENAGWKTHPVAELKPLLIEGHEFFDLYGNAAEWASDTYVMTLVGGQNPYSYFDGHSGVLRGGDAHSGSNACRSWFRSVRNTNTTSFGTGFRLVRTIQ